ncbi:GHKL domain-containing protein [Anaerorhabdus furcosa]|uniref:GHKL domain-containing protein n=1 Tax=Anaerorhabdus furcosa TaxID=118967 RepID=A0A1T4JW91_9FIRM|nr:GHKL domain-containing protein [Anaerorhabdus furcosa]SJZ34335.1 GHKL domain-containing protein [Anaerorhabdus furcosa]
MNIFDIAINTIESLLIYIFLSKYLRLNHHYSMVYIVLFTIISATLLTIINTISGYEGLLIFMLITPNFIFSFFFSDNDVYELIFINIFIYLIISLINSSLVVLTSIFVYHSLDSSTLLESNYYYFLAIASKIILFFVLSKVSKIRSEYKHFLREFESKLILFFSILLILVFLPFENILYNGELSISFFSIGIIALMIFTLFFVLSFFKFIELSNKLKDDELQIRIDNERLNNILEIKKINNHISELKHDMKHILRYIDSNLEQNKIETARYTISEYLNTIQSVKSVYISNNSVLDYCLNVLLSECHKKNIDITYTINSKLHFSMNEQDLLILLSNIFDNSMKYCSGKNYIKIDIYEINEYIKISILNSTEHEKIFIDLNRETTHGNHGFGLKSSINICERNNGKINFESKDFTFICTIILPM